MSNGGIAPYAIPPLWRSVPPSFPTKKLKIKSCHTGKVYFEVYLKSVGAKHQNESSLALGACLSLGWAWLSPSLLSHSPTQ